MGDTIGRVFAATRFIADAHSRQDAHYANCILLIDVPHLASKQQRRVAPTRGSSTFLESALSRAQIGLRSVASTASKRPKSAATRMAMLMGGYDWQSQICQSTPSAMSKFWVLSYDLCACRLYHQVSMGSKTSPTRFSDRIINPFKISHSIPDLSILLYDHGGNRSFDTAIV